MPELPEVEVILRGLLVLKGLAVTGIEAPRPGPNTPVDLESLSSATLERKLEEIERRGKYLLFRFSGPREVVFHLKMTGKLLLRGDFSEYARYHRVIISFTRGQKLIFNDVRRFGFCICDSNDTSCRTCLPEFGPDPLSPSFGAGSLSGSAGDRRLKLKNFILDQKVAPGIGNIYANEALFRAGLNPFRPVNTVGAGEWESLARSIRELLLEAIDYGGTTLGRGWSHFCNARGEPGRFQERLMVYGREGEACVRCDNEIRSMPLNNRSTFFCPLCQEV